MKKTKILLALVLFIGSIGLPFVRSQAQDVQEVTFMAFEIWPDFDRPEVLVINSLLLPPLQQLPATVRYPLPANSTLHTVAQFDETQNSLSDQVNYIQEGNELIIDLPTNGLRVEYYFPYEQSGQTRTVNFAWPSAFTVDLLQISVQQPRNATDFSLNADVLESRLTDTGLRYYNLPPSSVNQGEVVSLSFSYDLPENGLTVPPVVDNTPALEQESSLLNNLANNLPLVGVALLLLLVAVIFLRQGFQERTASTKQQKPLPNKVCASCGHVNKGGSKFCTQCGEPL